MEKFIKLKNKKVEIIIALLCILLIYITVNSVIKSETKNNIYASNGYLDLSGIDIEETHPLFINGEWEFYWDKLLYPEDFEHPDSLAPSYEKIPSTWTSYIDKNGENLKSQGKATYRLKVKLKEGNKSLGIKVNNIWGNAKLFIKEDGEGLKALENENGQELKTVDTKCFFVKSDSFDIILQIENEDVLKSGILKSIYIGSLDKTLELEETFFFFDIIGVIGMFMMGIYFISTTVQKRDFKSSLLLAIYSFIALIFISMSDEMVILYIFPKLKMVDIYITTLLIGLYFTYIFLKYLKYNYDIKTSDRIINYYGMSCLIFTIIIFITPITKIINIGQIEAKFGIVIVIYGVYILVKSIIVKKDGSIFNVLSLLSIMLIFFINVYNTLSKKQVNNLTPMYILIFTISQGMILSYRYSNFVEKIEELSNKLGILDKRKDEFLEKTSHELKIPLQGVVNISKALLEGVAGNLNYNQKENVEIISMVAQRLDILVDDILDYSNFTNGYILKETKAVNIKSQLMFVMNLVSYSIKDKPIVLENRIKSNTTIVLGESRRLKQVFYNILDTLLKYMDRGKIVVSIEGNDEYVIIEFSNDVYIKEEEDIFNNLKWLSDENELIKAKKHSSIGLFVAKEIIKLHNGEILFNSTKEKGSLFRVVLPLANNSYEDINSGGNGDLPVLHNSKGVLVDSEAKNSILIFEPDTIKERVIINSLTVEGYRIKCIKSVEEFLRVLDRGMGEDLIIMNSILTDSSGYELISEIRKKYNNVDLPILLIIDNSFSENISLAFHLGANDVIMEPYDIDILRTRVNTLIKLKDSFSALVSSEMNFLKAQIKPHFIFNVLSVISALISRDPKKAKKVLLDFSDYLRTSFDFSTEEDLTPISKEVDLIKTYVSIEKERFGDRLNVEFSIDEDINIMLPPLIIQPIVENAIRHGVLKRVEGGIVGINIFIENEDVVIRVYDDGVGIESHRLKNLLEGKDEKAGVGVKNINSRLIKSYGNGLSITSNLGQGTEIVMRIPYDRKGAL